MKKLNQTKVVLIIFFLLFTSCFIWCLGVEREGEELAAKVIRLHIVADSDGAEAQEIKLLVRDRVLVNLSPALKGCTTEKEASRVIDGKLTDIKTTAEETLRENGCYLPVSVTLQNEVFDQRQYDDFALPAGKYTALRIVIGKGSGHNWWCVVFPPLCLSSAIKEDENVLAVLNDDDIKLITDNGYVVKFKVLEIISKFKEKLKAS